MLVPKTIKQTVAGVCYEPSPLSRENSYICGIVGLGVCFCFGFLGGHCFLFFAIALLTPEQTYIKIMKTTSQCPYWPGKGRQTPN